MKGTVFLRQATVVGEVRFVGSRIGVDLDYALLADGLNLGGSVFMRTMGSKPFTARGEVRLIGADIGGELACSGGQLTPYQPPSGPLVPALTTDGITVHGGSSLDRNFLATGQVRLNGARVSGQVRCDGAFTPKQRVGHPSVEAISADGVAVEGGLLLRAPFRATGTVRLISAKVVGPFECNGMLEPEQRPGYHTVPALAADGIQVAGNVQLREGFCATGEVRLPGATVEGQLDFHGGRFLPQQRRGEAMVRALNLASTTVKGDLFLGTGFVATGEVRLLDAQVSGNVHCSGGLFTPPVGADAISAGRLTVGGDLTLGGATPPHSQAMGQVSLIGARVGRDLNCRGILLEPMPRSLSI